ncbi:MAG: prephenate dehydratase [Phycisphaerales bacterium]
MAKRSAKKAGKAQAGPRRSRAGGTRAASSEPNGAPDAPPPGASTPAPDKAGTDRSPIPGGEARLGELRERIDAVDSRLVELLNERASLVVDVGRVKRGSDIPVYAPHREAEVLGRAIAMNHGPLPDRTIEAIYRELMSGSFALEQPLRIGYLGPAGSYSHQAAMKHFGSSVAFEDLHEIRGVFTEVVRGHVHYGLVPIENSTGGGIAETLDAFREVAGKIVVYAEVQLAVHHALLANCEPSRVRRIHSKPEALGQCRMWLATQYPKAELIAAPSTSRAVQIAIEEDQMARKIGAEPGSAAIASSLAGQLYGLKVAFPRVEDDPNNVTRFLIISRQKAKPSGDDKTALMFNTADKPGALVEVLSVFDRAGVNLTHIDKRPSGRMNWEYTFFVDAQGHVDAQPLAGAIKEASTHCKDLTVLGSFPRSRRIL